MERIAHISDLHIGSHQWGIKERQCHHRLNLTNLAFAVREYDIVLVTGDVFDSPEPLPEDVVSWIYFCRDVKSRGAKLLANVGNHDMVHGSVYQWVEVGLLDESDNYVDPEGEGLYDTVDGINILNLDYIHKNNLTKEWTESIPEGIDIIMMHQSAAGFLPSIARPQLDEELLEALSKKCKYLALGDLHIHKIMKLPNGCIAAYPGTNFFLKLGEAHDEFKFIEIQIDTKKGNSLKVKSVPYEPMVSSYVINFFDVKRTLKEISKNQNGFYIIRHFPFQDEDIRELLVAANEQYPTAIIHPHRDKAPKEKEEVGETEEVTEDTDFISLVEKESSLEERDVDLISEIWSNPSTDNVAAILEKDLNETKDEIKQLHTKQ